MFHTCRMNCLIKRFLIEFFVSFFLPFAYPNIALPGHNFLGIYLEINVNESKDSQNLRWVDPERCTSGTWTSITEWKHQYMGAWTPYLHKTMCPSCENDTLAEDSIAKETMYLFSVLNWNESLPIAVSTSTIGCKSSHLHLELDLRNLHMKL